MSTSSTPVKGRSTPKLSYTPIKGFESPSPYFSNERSGMYDSNQTVTPSPKSRNRKHGTNPWILSTTSNHSVVDNTGLRGSLPVGYGGWSPARQTQSSAHPKPDDKRNEVYLFKCTNRPIYSKINNNLIMVIITSKQIVQTD